MIINSFIAVILIIAFGQSTPKLPSDFARFQKQSIEELQRKTEEHRQTWGLDKITRWDLNQDSGELIFSFAGALKAVCPAQIIGTYNTRDHTWLWAWANPSIDEKLTVDALKLRKYGEEHHIDRLTTRKWVGSEDEAWTMAALAVKLSGRQGAYRGPNGPIHVFMAFGEVTLTKN